MVSWRSFPTKFPMKSADFSKNLPLQILRNLTFFRENSAKSADFSANFDFFPVKKKQKSADFSVNFDCLPAKIPRNRPIFPRICPWKSREILLFFPRNIRSPVTCSTTYVILFIAVKVAVTWIAAKINIFIFGLNLIILLNSGEPQFVAEVPAQVW